MSDAYTQPYPCSASYGMKHYQDHVDNESNWMVVKHDSTGKTWQRLKFPVGEAFVETHVLEQGLVNMKFQTRHNHQKNWCCDDERATFTAEYASVVKCQVKPDCFVFANAPSALDMEVPIRPPASSQSFTREGTHKFIIPFLPDSHPAKQLNFRLTIVQQAHVQRPDGSWCWGCDTSIRSIQIEPDEPLERAEVTWGEFTNLRMSSTAVPKGQNTEQVRQEEEEIERTTHQESPLPLLRRLPHEYIGFIDVLVTHLYTNGCCCAEDPECSFCQEAVPPYRRLWAQCFDGGDGVGHGLVLVVPQYEETGVADLTLHDENGLTNNGRDWVAMISAVPDAPLPDYLPTLEELRSRLDMVLEFTGNLVAVQVARRHYAQAAILQQAYHEAQGSPMQDLIRQDLRNSQAELYHYVKAFERDVHSKLAERGLSAEDRMIQELVSIHGLVENPWAPSDLFSSIRRVANDLKSDLWVLDEQLYFPSSSLKYVVQLMSRFFRKLKHLSRKLQFYVWTIRNALPGWIPQGPSPANTGSLQNVNGVTMRGVLDRLALSDRAPSLWRDLDRTVQFLDLAGNLVYEEDKYRAEHKSMDLGFDSLSSGLSLLILTCRVYRQLYQLSRFQDTIPRIEVATTQSELEWEQSMFVTTMNEFASSPECTILDAYDIVRRIERISLFRRQLRTGLAVSDASRAKTQITAFESNLNVLEDAAQADETTVGMLLEYYPELCRGTWDRLRTRLVLTLLKDTDFNHPEFGLQVSPHMAVTWDDGILAIYVKKEQDHWTKGEILDLRDEEEEQEEEQEGEEEEDGWEDFSDRGST